jgi:hypothetical protein
MICCPNHRGGRQTSTPFDRESPMRSLREDVSGNESEKIHEDWPWFVGVELLGWNEVELRGLMNRWKEFGMFELEDGRPQTLVLAIVFGGSSSGAEVEHTRLSK